MTNSDMNVTFHVTQCTTARIHQVYLRMWHYIYIYICSTLKYNKLFSQFLVCIYILNNSTEDLGFHFLVTLVIVRNLTSSFQDSVDDRYLNL